MEQNDTLNLLHECESGVKMGIESIDEVIDRVKSKSLRRELAKSRGTHVEMNEKLASLIKKLGGTSREPNLMSKGMSWIKTNVNLALDESDSTVAELMTDGCNMGIKSLNKYMNEYRNASPEAKMIAQTIINAEKKLAFDIRSYL